LRRDLHGLSAPVAGAIEDGDERAGDAEHRGAVVRGETR
jgi:hypothetical protein